jgi:membrane protein DedA with SNARE-associated domain
MENMSKALRITFIIHAIIAILLGAPLLIAPGRFLGAFGWAPVDPLLDRVLGAALLALAWNSYQGWRAKERAQVTVSVEMEAIFCVLACLGLLRHLLKAHYPLIVWLVFVVLAIFAVVWIGFWIKKPKDSE